jgi:hypothetical protein
MIVKEDIAIEHIREVRHQISVEFGHDPKKLVDHYIELQKRYKDRMKLTTPPKPEAKDVVTQRPDETPTFRD